jgi:CelD/BcsL family acetyltransferase involved in cellulose biosynthesis
MDITLHTMIEDTAEGTVYQRRVRKRVADGAATVEMSVPGNPVPPETVASTHPEVIRHELRQYVSIKNQEAALRRMPEARRRKEERRLRRRLEEERRTRECQSCDGSGWGRDHEGNQVECPECNP